MIRRVTLPKLSANVEEAVLTTWYRAEGEAVRKGEPLLEMTTDKAAFDIESPSDGVLRRRLAEKGSTVPVGYVLALVGAETDRLPQVAPHNRRLLDKQRRGPSRRRASPPSAGGRRQPARSRVRATPAARRLARESGLDLADVQRATKLDVVTESAVSRFLESGSNA